MTYYRALPPKMKSLYSYLTDWLDYTHTEAVEEIERIRRAG
jgi:hypothetical protein